MTSSVLRISGTIFNLTDINPTVSIWICGRCGFNYVKTLFGLLNIFLRNTHSSGGSWTGNGPEWNHLMFTICLYELTLISSQGHHLTTNTDIYCFEGKQPVCSFTQTVSDQELTVQDYWIGLCIPEGLGLGIQSA